MSKSVFNTTVNSVFAVYTPKYYDTLLSVQMALDSLCDIPDDFWPTRQDLPEDAQDPQLLYILSVFQDPLLAVQNSLFATFNINGFSSIGSDFSGESYELDEQVAETNWTKFNLVARPPPFPYLPFPTQTKDSCLTTHRAVHLRLRGRRPNPHPAQHALHHLAHAARLDALQLLPQGV
ncbi:hypothetical protein B0T22DRAFT_472087 [Podospora appendiculata]|uniref:Uncharacterized protein n=1 Tax=Podospora appendiculata TaxID=314037 RepID=A0AAE0X1U4_9PEZI|nr:hypothetical protein B0T22DRAFT_472087 [Podospora appendiculata]